MLQYKKKMQDCDILTLDDVNLDRAFVAKARDFEQKIEAESLSDEEIAQIDEELSVMFDELHEVKEVDSDDVVAMKKQNAILIGKQKVDSAKTIEELKVIRDENSELKEVVEYCDKKANLLKSQAEKQEKAKKKQDELKKRIDTAAGEHDLNEIIRENADNKEIVQLAQVKLQKIKEGQKKPEPTRQEKLLSKESFTYAELRELGIEPTGDDMLVDDVMLGRVYMFKVYEVHGLKK